MKPSFCGGCTRVTADLQLDDGYWWCGKCRGERPVARQHSSGYECPEHNAPDGGMRAAFSRGAARAMERAPRSRR